MARAKTWVKGEKLVVKVETPLLMESGGRERPGWVSGTLAKIEADLRLRVNMQSRLDKSFSTSYFH